MGNGTVKEINKTYKSLVDILGEQKICTDVDILDKYSRDESPDFAVLPNIVVRAESVEDVAAVLRICNRDRTPVTPRGAGSGVTGGSVPVCGGVVISLEKLCRILEIDTENMVAVVEPGVITGDIQKALDPHGLMYPPDPASLEICSIGGNVAENAGGPRAIKYGTTKDYVLGLEFVLPDGSVINTGKKLVKNVTGYNLAGIITGSEGTLAVVTKIYLKLIPMPRFVKDILIPFESLESAIDTVFMILLSRVVPATLEFMEEDAIRLVAKHLQQNMPFPEAGAHLLIQLDGNSEDVVFNDLETITSIVKTDPNKIFVAESLSQRERLWKARRSIREALRSESPVFLAEDCVVPRNQIPSFMKAVKSYCHDRHLNSVMFGHAGDGNVHIDILKNDIPYEQWEKYVPEIKSQIYRRALSCGGTITGEHGIGYLRKDYISMALSNDEIELLKRIKAAFDPNMILNPGKIFT